MDLSGLDWTGQSFAGLPLTGASLVGTTLEGASLDTDLTNTRAYGVQGQPAALPAGMSLVDMPGGTTRAVVGPGISLAGADLTGVDLRGST